MVRQPEGEMVYFGKTIVVWFTPCINNTWGTRIPEKVWSKFGIKPISRKKDYNAYVKIGIQNNEIIISVCCDPPNCKKNKKGECKTYKIRRNGWIRIPSSVGLAVGLQPEKDYCADIYIQGCWIILTNFREICQCEKS
jgi:hypothetical protein